MPGERPTQKETDGYCDRWWYSQLSIITSISVHCNICFTDSNCNYPRPVSQTVKTAPGTLGQLPQSWQLKCHEHAGRFVVQRQTDWGISSNRVFVFIQLMSWQGYLFNRVAACTRITTWQLFRNLDENLFYLQSHKCTLSTRFLNYTFLHTQLNTQALSHRA